MEQDGLFDSEGRHPGERETNAQKPGWSRVWVGILGFSGNRCSGGLAGQFSLEDLDTWPSEVRGASTGSSRTRDPVLLKGSGVPVPVVSLCFGSVRWG